VTKLRIAEQQMPTGRAARDQGLFPAAFEPLRQGQNIGCQPCGRPRPPVFNVRAPAKMPRQTTVWRQYRCPGCNSLS